jgi:hypothetical protein
LSRTVLMTPGGTTDEEEAEEVPSAEKSNNKL